MVEVQVAPPVPRSVLFDACRTDLSELQPRVVGVVQSFVAQHMSRLALAEEQHAREAEVLREQQIIAQADRKEVVEALLSLSSECPVKELLQVPCLPDDTRLALRVSAFWQALITAYEARVEAITKSHLDSVAAQALSHKGQVERADESTAALRKQVEDLQKAAIVAESAAKSTRQLLSKDLEKQQERVSVLSLEVSGLEEECKCLRVSVEDMTRDLQRAEYDKEAALDGFASEKAGLEQIVEAGKQELLASQSLVCELRAEIEKRQQAVDRMRHEMIEQEQVLVEKVNRVQQYMKERSAGAMTAERRQQDAELMAERWQEDLRRMTADRDRLAKLLIEQEASCHQLRLDIRRAKEVALEESSNLREKFAAKERECRDANLELLEKRDHDYTSKLSLDKGKEKDRTALILRRKEKDLATKDQQLQTARARIAELEQSLGTCGKYESVDKCSLPPLLATPRARGS
jgi:DNA repair exonuclease SbcCD ATPase subunit